MHVEGIGRLTKVEKVHSLLFSIVSQLKKVLHKSHVLTLLGKKTSVQEAENRLCELVRNHSSSHASASLHVPRFATSAVKADFAV